MAFKNPATFFPNLNTGGLVDLSNGRFVPGVDGNHILNGGVSLLNGIMGRAQTYKSAVAGSMAVRVIENYARTTANLYETEFTMMDPTPIRYDDFVTPGYPPVSDDISLIKRTDMDISEYFAYLKELTAERQSRAKELVVESPFLNHKTGKPHTVWTPHIEIIDSWSKMSSAKEDELMDASKSKLDDSSNNTLYMYDGKLKTILIRLIPSMAYKHGIYFITTAHIKNVIEMNAYSHTPKQLQHIKGQGKISNVGSEYEYLLTSLIQVNNASVLADKNGSEYPMGEFTTDKEINLIEGIQVRGKSCPSGGGLPMVVSQYQGLLDGVTDYRFCTKEGYGHNSGGMGGGEKKFYLYPDVAVTKKNVRQLLGENYELRRAIQITAQLCYIKSFWSAHALPEWFTVKAAALVKKLLERKDTPTMSDILNSTCIWTYEKKQDDRPYMSIFDIVKLAG